MNYVFIVNNNNNLYDSLIKKKNNFIFEFTYCK